MARVVWSRTRASRRAASRSVSPSCARVDPFACPALGARPRRRSRAARYGPGASIPRSATQVPISTSAAWWSVVRIQSSGTSARGWGPSTDRVRSTVRVAGSTRASCATCHLNGDSSGRACLSAGSETVPRPRVVLLVRERVSPGLLAFPFLADRADRLEQSDRIVLVDQLLRGEVHEAVEFPPHRLVLAPMPAEQLAPSSQRACCSSSRSAASVGTSAASRSARA